MSKHLKEYIIENSKLMSEWDWDSNNANGWFPNEITCGSIKPVYWLCNKCQMSYQARIPDRIGKNCGCPYCAGKKPIPGVNDLETWCKTNGREDLLVEWNPAINNGKLPSEFLFASNKEIIWECSHCGAKFPKRIDQRTLRCSGCRECRITGTSFPEQYLYYGLNSIIGHIKNAYKGLGFEIDIFLETLNIAIEYNGEFFHKFYSREKFDSKKVEKCAQKGIHLLTINESREEIISINACSNIIQWQYSRNKDKLLSLLAEVLDWINFVANTNYTIHGIDNIAVYQQALKHTYGVSFEKSLANKFPEIAAEWDYEKNGDILPQNVSAGSHDSFSWICKKCGHRWIAAICDRTNGHGCYVCSKEKWANILHERAVNRNNLKSWCENNNRELLLLEWDYELNQTGPEEWSPGSNEEVHWICSTCGHQYSASINNRVRGSGCKECWNIKRRTMHSNNTPIQTENSLVAWCIRNNSEDLLAEWDYEQNMYPPENYTYGSKKRVFWKCHCGHTWPAEIKSRTTQGNGCKKCSLAKRFKK